MRSSSISLFFRNRFRRALAFYSKRLFEGSLVFCALPMMICAHAFASGSTQGVQLQPQAGSREGLSLRLGAAGELKFIVADHTGKTKALEPHEFAGAITALHEMIERYPCRSQFLPETGVIKFGLLELTFLVRELCEAREMANSAAPTSGTSTSTQGGSASPQKPVLNPSARPGTTGFGE